MLEQADIRVVPQYGVVDVGMLILSDAYLKKHATEFASSADI